MTTVDLEQVDAEHMAGIVAKLGIVVDPPVSPGKMVSAMEVKFRATKEALIECSRCRGMSPSSFDACPFCGDEDEVGSGSGVDAGAESSEDVGSVSAPDSESTIAKSKVAGANGAPKALAGLNGHAKKPKASKSPPSSTAIVVAKPVVVTATAVPTLSSKDLDRSVERILFCKENIGTNFHALGLETKRVYDSAAWRVRLDDEGKPMYRSFLDWVDREAGVSRTTAYSAMDAAATYSPELVAKIGREKLSMVMGAPVEDRPEIEKLALEGASKAKVREKAKALKEARAGKPSAAPKSEPKKTDELNVMMTLKKKYLIFGWKQDPAANGERVPAKRLADAPWGFVDLPNGTQISVGIRTHANGQLQFVLQVKRD